ncbi:peptidoglycan DD-metalloendopeptidase family protein [Duncaniella sp.]|uniref:murein hydrolase activator EnvC family protein n=1 Tax=Duncaniella sp. TaxID=2518496 RepID=UPI0023C99738|nr:peptidoglycan DD-metalloendopeptidase family protein [Duncaniella sp.]MDE5905748.1 peptidoglycan DD-metalloendopeptidase family protein [Duncaniella sp.]
MLPSSRSENLLKLCRSLVVLLLVAIIGAGSPADAQTRRKSTKTTTARKTATKQKTATRTLESVRKDKSTTEKKISETATKLNTNTKELQRQINRLNSLNGDIEANRNKVRDLRSHIDSLGTAINATADSIKILEDDLEAMRLAYAKALRKLQPHAASTGELSFIFSAKSFSEAYSRIRYLRRFSAWRERRAENIRRGIDRIAAQRARLTSLRHSQDQAYRKAEETQSTLSRQQAESEKMVTSLRKEDSALRAMLKEQKRKSAALDRELDRLIAAEQARIAREEAEKARREKEKNKTKSSSGSKGTTASDAGRSAKDVASANAPTRTAASTSASALTGSFEANKGRLLFPVAGSYKIVRRFGRQPHPTLRHVETENSGIDIEVSPGTQARSIFAGKVSAIFRQDGFNSIVMIRHGRYISIYANLSAVTVKQGDSVKAGQNIGTVFSDPDDSNRTTLHFEIRNERQKLNPSQWVR